MDERDLLSRLTAAVDSEIEGALDTRTRLAACPELAGAELQTAETLERAIGGTQRVLETGIVARAGLASDAVAVRAELDAIEVDGRVLHACGHDAHMAALVALIRAARRIEADLPAQLVAAFQPSEEAYPSGAARMVEAGALGDRVRAVIAAHVDPGLAWGQVSCDPGVVNAASDLLDVTMVGGAGHVAYPEHYRNPIIPLSAFVTGVGSGVFGDQQPADTLAVVSAVRADGPGNVVPTAARAIVALRALDAAARARLRQQVGERATQAAREHGCEVQIELTVGEPPLVNDAVLSERTAHLVEHTGLLRAPGRSSFGSDDFAYFGAVAPLLMMFVGLDGAPGAQAVGLHHPQFAAPDAAVRNVALAMAAGFCAAAVRAPG